MLCEKEIFGKVSGIVRHTQGKYHQMRLRKLEEQYKTYVQQCRRWVLRAKRPRNRHLRRLRYYVLLNNFEASLN